MNTSPNVISVTTTMPGICPSYNNPVENRMPIPRVMKNALKKPSTNIVIIIQVKITIGLVAYIHIE